MTKDEVLDRLRNLQDVLVKKITLEKDIEDIPKSLSKQEELVRRLKEKFIESDQKYVALKKDENECKNALLIAEDEREKAEKKMEIAGTQREIEALDKEIETAAKKEDEQRKKLQKISQESITLNESMKQDKEFMDEQEAELIERKKSVNEEVERKKAEIATIREKEVALAEGLNPELVFKFERIVRKKKGRGIVAVRGKEHPVCQSCRMILPVQFAVDVRVCKDPENPPSCPYCSSILYYDEAQEEDEVVFDEEDAGSLAGLDDLDEEFDEKEEEIAGEEDINIDYEE